MMSITTKEQAQKYRYGSWSGNPHGDAYRHGFCAYEIFGELFYGYQCRRKNGHGPDELYCKQHAKIMAGER